ncbi:hypothetical protein RvY_09795 [Ramazzottius varieornatus]|uniref:RED-like N-terminal domain-containing protein n=1 Tax=Ramazzottius varieornatus TaxID=947166 RepID=A0A1D1VAL0_RAMVA|nr:hypothetical protein RvY_09795 [Ramazzottius varieornatus]
MAGSESVRMSNDDFRKILMTPRSGDKPATLGTPSAAATPNRNDKKAKYRPQKKKVPAPPKFEDGEEAAKLDANYRDRAKERREHTNKEHDDLIMLAATAGYKAVAPDFQSGLDAAERRRKIIEESKYLGGDIEHTHLVKGLDYALLQKVRTEISSTDDDDVPPPQADEKETSRSKKDKSGKDLLAKKEGPKVVEADKDPEFKTRMAKNIYNILFKREVPQKNQFFRPGRMAFLWDLDDEMGNWETPTTILRSKAELRQDDNQPQNADHEIVIEKLTNILTQMRTGVRKDKRQTRKDKRNEFADVRAAAAKDSAALKKAATENIFDDAADAEYKPTVARLFAEKAAAKSVPYFKKPEGAPAKESAEAKQQKDREYIQNVVGAAKKLELKEAVDQGETSITKAKGGKEDANRLRVESGPDSYAECYPGFDEAMDAAVDSDEEDDLTKMDMGNNKSAISRKKFDTEEDFSNYMSQREALPKAAFQYGVKMTDGRKKKGGSSAKGDKSKLNNEWTKISALIQKRKDGPDDGNGAKRTKTVES